MKLKWETVCLFLLLLVAAFILFVLPFHVEPGELTRPPYKRSEWLSSWVDADNDCQDTRQEVLIRDSRLPVLWRDERKCEVAWGAWVDPYSGATMNDPLSVHIDHIVSLKEMHEFGGWRWERAQRAHAANWRYNLVAVSAETNTAKGSRGLHQWRPSKPGSLCRYVEIRATVWMTLRLQPQSRLEADTARQILDSCQPFVANAPSSTLSEVPPPVFVGP